MRTQAHAVPRWLIASLALLFFLSMATSPAIASVPKVKTAAPVRHVLVIMLENQPFQSSFGKHSPAPYLARVLPAKGALLKQYYAIGHYSLDNYIALISGQAPNVDSQDDCHIYSNFKLRSEQPGAYGQALGKGCIYPSWVQTLAGQLQAKGYTWKGYFEDMGRDLKRESASCAHVPIGAKDWTEHATAKDQYAAKHNPFVYFHSIIDDQANCDAHVVNLNQLQADLRSIQTTPNYSFIVPNLCHDGHDALCANGQPGGLASVNQFLKIWVPKILAAPAFRKNGLLLITFDEGSASDGRACCHEMRLPGGPKPGRIGPGGGRIGAVALSPFIKPGTVSEVSYNHYSFLRTVEDFFGLAHLGYAATPGLKTFGRDVFTGEHRKSP